MIKQDIIQRIAEKLDMPKVLAAKAVNGIFDVLIEALKDGERIELRGFGVLMVKNRKTGVGRNPKTGEEVSIPKGKTVRFKPGKNLSSEYMK
ncbi:MAG: integration host factor subunit beta [Acidobacteria bacterium]|nr:integration host factor subunit beta [Acidobacteriota bacterium]